MSVALVTAARGRQLLDKMTDPPQDKPPALLQYVGRLGSGVRVRAVFKKIYTELCPMAAKKEVLLLGCFVPGGVCPATVG